MEAPEGGDCGGMKAELEKNTVAEVSLIAISSGSIDTKAGA
jgi:hypothetical protein